MHNLYLISYLMFAYLSDKGKESMEVSGLAAAEGTGFNTIVILFARWHPFFFFECLIKVYPYFKCENTG
jgi:hypothetical protein